jgi:hypothetical protein
MKVEQLTAEQRMFAIQRLTALWAFCESGLGGVLHALHVPFTGLVVGGFAVIIITLIAYFSKHRYTQILQSLMIVLIVKALVSPHTPFPAYVAVGFQAAIGFALFGFLHINFLSILLLSMLAMIESAAQKLLILTLFFGKSLWKAADEAGNLISKQLSISPIDGSTWVIGTYLIIYIIGGILVALLANKILKQITFKNNDSLIYVPGKQRLQIADNRKRFRKKLLFIVTCLLIISALLFIADSQSAPFAIFKTLIWTISAVVIWYVILSPLFTRLMHWMLKKRQDEYSEQIGAILYFLPVLKHITITAWKASEDYKGWHRIIFFITTLINWSLTYSEVEIVPSAT